MQMIEIQLSEVRVGDRVRWNHRGNYGFGRVLKVNKTTFLCTDEKYGSEDIFMVAKGLCIQGLRNPEGVQV